MGSRHIAFCIVMHVFALAGCKESATNQFEMALPNSGPTPAVATLTSLDDGNFYTNGFPTDLRRDEQNRINIADFPRQEHWLTRRYVESIKQGSPGYSTIMPIYLPFTKAINIDALSDWDADYTDSQAPIQLIDIDPDSEQFGRHFPLQISMTHYPDSYRPNHLLQVIPTLGINLRPNTTYALFVTNATPLYEADQWEQNPQLTAVLSPENDSMLPANVRAVYAPLRNYLAQQQLDFNQIVAATVWTTGNPVARFHQAAEQIAAQAAALPTLPVSALEKFDDYPEYCVIRGFVDLPGYQKGTPPYLLSGGEIEWDTNDVPVQQYQRKAEFILTIPKFVAMPAQGFPLLSYVHGAGGRARQVYDRGEFDHVDFSRYPYYIGKAGEGPSQIAAERGWASSGLAGHVSYDHIPQWGSVNGTMMYNLYNPVGLAGIYMTLAWERIYFRRIVDRIEVDASLCPEADPGPGQTRFRFDPDMQVNLGQSQGNWVSSLMVSADPRPYQGVIFSGAAATWIRLFNNNPGFELSMNTAVVNRIPFLNLDDAHPFLMLMEWMLGAVDTATNLDSLMRYPAKTPPQVIGFSGWNDYMLSETTQRPFFMIVGSDLVGDDLGVAPQRSFLPRVTLSGAQQLPYPAAGNYSAPGYGERTNVVMRYRGDNPALLYNGHEVLFQTDAIKHQYGCFLQHLSQNITPIVDVGYAQGGPCL